LKTIRDRGNWELDMPITSIRNNAKTKNN